MIVTIVAGPPGAGKTTYVSERARRGDLVLDVDALFVALSGGLEWYDKPSPLLPFVLAVRDALITKIRGGDDALYAWVITSEANPHKRKQLVEKCGGAQVFVLAVTTAECMRRITNDKRRGATAEFWRPLIEQWWAEYEPGENETIVR